MNVREAILTTLSNLPPVESASVTSGVRSPPVVIDSSVVAVHAAPADVGSATPVDLVGGHLTTSVTTVDVVALCRRVEACERRLALMCPSPHYCSLRCERLERKLGNSCALVSHLRDKLEVEMALTDHWRRQVDLRHSRMSLLVAELGHSDDFNEPLKGGTGRPTRSSMSPTPSRCLTPTRVSSEGCQEIRPQVIGPKLP
uniref:Uncharacterized protein n=1 Tax=Peronospora matthiolae TaxID=2874970 RepID=A0AAV1VCE0_9STRA